MSPSPQRRADDDEIQGAEAQQVSQRPATEEEIRTAEAQLRRPACLPVGGDAIGGSGGERRNSNESRAASC